MSVAPGQLGDDVVDRRLGDISTATSSVHLRPGRAAASSSAAARLQADARSPGSWSPVRARRASAGGPGSRPASGTARSSRPRRHPGRAAAGRVRRHPPPTYQRDVAGSEARSSRPASQPPSAGRLAAVRSRRLACRRVAAWRIDLRVEPTSGLAPRLVADRHAHGRRSRNEVKSNGSRSTCLAHRLELLVDVLGQTPRSRTCPPRASPPFASAIA